MDLFEEAKKITDLYSQGMREGAAIQESKDKAVLREILRLCREQPEPVRLTIAALVSKHLDGGEK